MFSGHNVTRPVPKYRFPRDETLPRDAFQLVADEVMLDGNARQNLATFCQTWEEPELLASDGALGQQELDRQGRVPADRRGRSALRAHAGRPVACARGGQHRRHLGHRVLGGLHAGGHGGQVAVAGQAASGGQADRQAEHGVRPGAGGLAQVRPLLGHRNPRGPDVPRALRHGSRRCAGPGGREHDHGRPDVRRHLHRRLRAGGGHRQGARPAAGRHRPRRRHPRGRGQRRLPRPVLRAGRGVRLPPPPGQVDQHLGAQVRAGPAGRRLGHLAGPRRNSPRT